MSLVSDTHYFHTVFADGSDCLVKFTAVGYRRSRRGAAQYRGADPVHRLYTGSRADLQGKMALVVRSDHPDVVFAQFDYANNGHLNLCDPLCHGWHRFPALSFKTKGLRK